eukprot:scaffold18035_cov106-Isochrysis_galbana.AAC.3
MELERNVTYPPALRPLPLHAGARATCTSVPCSCSEAPHYIQDLARDLAVAHSAARRYLKSARRFAHPLAGVAHPHPAPQQATSDWQLS